MCGKYVDNYAKCKICICFLGVDKWRNQKNSKHLFTITPETQKHSVSHFATIPLKPTILSGFKASDPACLHPIARIKSIPAVPLAASPDRLARPGGILPFYRRGKQQNNEIAAQTGGWQKLQVV